MVELREILDLLSTFIGVAGGAWLAWGVISLGFENDNPIWPHCAGLIWPHPWSYFRLPCRR